MHPENILMTCLIYICKKRVAQTQLRFLSCMSQKGKQLNLERRSSWRKLPIQLLCDINFLSPRFLVSIHPLQFQALFFMQHRISQKKRVHTLVFSAERDDGTHFSPCAVVIL